jgi:hypothetical protein
MKKVLLFSAALFFIAMNNTAGAATIGSNTASNFTVSATPPAAVISSFHSLFGNAPVSQWKLRSDGTWRAHFTFNGTPWEATFSANGTLLKSEPK